MYRIMIADDEGIVIDSLKFIIESEYPGEYEIETAKTGRSVIELAERFRPDIAFMDIQMPGINGIDAMREIKLALLEADVNFLVVKDFVKRVEARAVSPTSERTWAVLDSNQRPSGCKPDALTKLS